MEQYTKKRFEIIRLQAVTNYWPIVMDLNKVIIRYGMSDTNVYQNKWARPTGTTDTTGLATNLAGATREWFRADYSYLAVLV